MVVDSSMSIAGRASRIIRCQYPDIEIPVVPITEFVFARARERGDKPAIIDGTNGRVLTYAELDDSIRRTAAGLAARGFSKGDVLGVYSPNVVEYAVAFHAAASLGGISTTVNPLYTTRELAQQLHDCSAKFLLTVPPLMDNARAAVDRSPSIRETFVFGEAEGATPFAELSKHGDKPPAVAIDPHTDLVALPYSSGTTGLAKGVMLTHHNLVAELKGVDGRPDIVCPTDADTLLAFLPFFHIYGIVMFLNFALWRGATVVSMPRFDLEHYLEMIQRFKVTYLHLVPPIVVALAKHPLVDKYDLHGEVGALSRGSPRCPGRTSFHGSSWHAAGPGVRDDRGVGRHPLRLVRARQNQASLRRHARAEHGVPGRRSRIRRGPGARPAGRNMGSWTTADEGLSGSARGDRRDD